MAPSHVSQRGARFIARFEGFSSRAYADANGDATIGYGHKLHAGPPTAEDKAHNISHDAALTLLVHDCSIAAECIRQRVHPPIEHQSKFDALVSFVFNVGCGAFASSTLLRDLNVPFRGDAIEHELRRWVNGNSGPLAGLVNRRNAEALLWRSGTYGDGLPAAP